MGNTPRRAAGEQYLPKPFTPLQSAVQLSSLPTLQISLPRSADEQLAAVDEAERRAVDEAEQPRTGDHLMNQQRTANGGTGNGITVSSGPIVDFKRQIQCAGMLPMVVLGEVGPSKLLRVQQSGKKYLCLKEFSSAEFRMFCQSPQFSAEQRISR